MIGADIASAQFMITAMASTRHRLKMHKRVEQQQQHLDLTKLMNLNNWTFWPKFKNILMLFLNQKHGIALCSLIYVIRDNVDMDDNAQSNVHNTDKNKLV